MPLQLLALLLLQAPLTQGMTVDLPKPGGFDYMTFDPKYDRVFASHPGAGTLAVYDKTTGKARDLPTDGEVNGVQIDPALDRVFIAGGGGHLMALSRSTLETLGEATLGGPGDDIAIDTKRQQITVCHDDGTEDWIFDAKTLKLLGTVTVAGAPEYVEYDAKTDKMYQNIKPTNQLQVIDPSSRMVVANWDTAPVTSPHGLMLDRKTGRAFSAGRNGKLIVFDIRKGAKIATVDIAPGTDQIAFDPGLKRVYCPGSGQMSVVQETADGATLLGSIAIPRGVHTLTVDPKTHDVWVCYGDKQSAHFMQLKVGQ